MFRTEIKVVHHFPTFNLFIQSHTDMSGAPRGHIVWVPVQVPVSVVQGQLPTSYPFQQAPPQHNLNHAMPVLQLPPGQSFQQQASLAYQTSQSSQMARAGYQGKSRLAGLGSRSRADGQPSGVNNDIHVRSTDNFDPNAQIPHITQIMRIGDAPVHEDGVVVEAGCEPPFLGPETCGNLASRTVHYPYSDH